jgi:hypothetical protein
MTTPEDLVFQQIQQREECFYELDKLILAERVYNRFKNILREPNLKSHYNHNMNTISTLLGPSSAETEAFKNICNSIVNLPSSENSTTWGLFRTNIITSLENKIVFGYFTNFVKGF